MEDGIGLAEMIISLRSELLRAQEDPDMVKLPLVTGPVELRLTVAVTRKVGAKTGIRFWVLDAGADVEHSGVTTQSFNITLNPIDPATGDPAKVAMSRAFRASDN